MRYFLEVAESEHVTHSAQKLRVSQPSLTQAISRLERELGVQLFEPEGRGIRLTEAGRFYSKRIAKAVGEIDSATSELARFDEERSSIVRINVFRPRTSSLTPSRNGALNTPRQSFRL